MLMVLAVLALGAFYPGSGAEQLDWKPTRSPQVEAQNEIDDVAQMLEAQNERRRRRGLPDRTEEEVAAVVRRDHAERKERAAAFRAREGEDRAPGADRPPGAHRAPGADRPPGEG